jgi:hypothetical protein
VNEQLGIRVSINSNIEFELQKLKNIKRSGISINDYQAVLKLLDVKEKNTKKTTSTITR